MMNTTAELVDNQMNFDPTMESTSSPEQSHNKPLSTTEAMVAKVTHPPTTVPEFQGLPTQDARTQVVYNMRNIDVLKVPITFNRKTVLFEETYWDRHDDYSLIVPNGARIKWFGVCYNTTGNFPNQFYEQDQANVGVQDNFDFKSWQATVNLYRPCYKSITLYANVTAFNNQGIISVQQFNPNILFAGAVAEFSYTHAQHFLSMLDAHYLKHGADFFTREETHPNFNPSALDAWFKTRKIKPCGLQLDPDRFVQIINLGHVGYESDSSSIVPTPSQIAQNSMRSYQDKFVNGAFAVNRINTISPAWMAGSNTSQSKFADGLYDCWTFTIASDGSFHYVALNENCASGASPSDLITMRDTLWTKDMTWTFIRMQGITPNSNSGDLPSVVSPIAVKNYYGIEAQPVWNGPWNGVSRVSPKPSLNDMQLLLDTFYEMPDAMPSKYNALGAFLPFLASALPHALGFIKDLIAGGKKEQPAPAAIAAPTTSRKAKALKPRNRGQGSSTKEKKLQSELDKLRKKFSSMQVRNDQHSKGKRNNNSQKRRKRTNTM